MIYCVFRVKEDTDTNVEFIYNDSYNEPINRILTILNRGKDLFIGKPIYDISEKQLRFANDSETTLLVRMNGNIPDEIIGVDIDNVYYMADVLNSENTDKSRQYSIFTVHGHIEK